MNFFSSRDDFIRFVGQKQADYGHCSFLRIARVARMMLLSVLSLYLLVLQQNCEIFARFKYYSDLCSAIHKV